MTIVTCFLRKSTFYISKSIDSDSDLKLGSMILSKTLFLEAKFIKELHSITVSNIWMIKMPINVSHSTQIKRVSNPKTKVPKIRGKTKTETQ